MALPPAGSTAVLPHEDTYAVAVEGRRALLAATRTDLEPIVLAHDPDPVVAELTERARQGAPTLEVHDTDGVEHRLWRVTDPELLEGPHRRPSPNRRGHRRRAPPLRRRPGQRPGGPPGARQRCGARAAHPHGARRPAGRPDPPRRAGPDLDAAVAAARTGFRVTEGPEPSERSTSDVGAAVRRWLASGGQSGFLVTDGHRLVQLDEPSDAVLAAVPSEAPAAWRGLDVVLAHHGLLELLWQRQ